MSLSPCSAERCAGFDCLRIAAAIGIVWFHVDPAPGVVVAYAALPVFIVLTLALPLLRPRPVSADRVLKRRAVRLLLPWGVWYAVYAVLAVRNGTRIIDAPTVGALLYGPAIHLWFLPFAFVAGVVVDLIGPRLLSRPMPVAIAASGLGAASVLFATAALGGLPTPWAQIAFAASVVPFAIAIGAAGQLQQQRPVALMVATVTAWTVPAAAWALGASPKDGGSAAIAVSVVAGAMLVPVPSSVTLSRLAGLTMGVYLIHPIALWAVYSRLDAPAWYALVGGGVVGGAIGAAGLRLHPVLALVFFGETQARRAPGRSRPTEAPAAVPASIRLVARAR